MIYAIDFDGVLVENEYPEIGPLNERAKQLVTSIKEHGDTFILWTCRSGEELDAAVKVLEDAGIPRGLIVASPRMLTALEKIMETELAIAQEHRVQAEDSEIYCIAEKALRKARNESEVSE